MIMAWWFEFWRTMMLTPIKREPKQIGRVRTEGNVIYVRAAFHRNSA